MREIGWAIGKEPVLCYLPKEEICRLEPTLLGPIMEDKGRDTVFDNTKIKQFVPDFECTTSFRQYMKQCLAWYNENPSRKTIEDKSNQIMDLLATKAQ